MKLNLPKLIPIFPLGGVVYFPRTSLPLNIFEQRYLDLINDCMKNNKLMGVVQNKRNNDELYDIGCLGKVTNFKKNNDGRITISLEGLTRFKIINEVSNRKLYREVNVEYSKFSDDLLQNQEDINQNKINFVLEKVKILFSKNNLLLNWNELEKLKIVEQINTLSMIAPISNGEKQKLLETMTLTEKLNTLSDIIEFYLYENGSGLSRLQ